MDGPVRQVEGTPVCVSSLRTAATCFRHTYTQTLKLPTSKTWGEGASPEWTVRGVQGVRPAFPHPSVPLHTPFTTRYSTALLSHSHASLCTVCLLFLFARGQGCAATSPRPARLNINYYNDNKGHRICVCVCVCVGRRRRHGLNGKLDQVVCSFFCWGTSPSACLGRPEEGRARSRGGQERGWETGETAAFRGRASCLLPDSHMLKPASVQSAPSRRGFRGC